VVENLLHGTSPEETIRACRDLHEFTAVYNKGPTIRAVKLASSPDDAGQSMPDLVRFYLGGGSTTCTSRTPRAGARCRTPRVP
jgi:hypothetical protein